MALPAQAVALAACGHQLAVVHSSPGGPALADGSQCLQYSVYDVTSQALLHSGMLPLSPRSTLAWVGFSEEGGLLLLGGGQGRKGGVCWDCCWGCCWRCCRGCWG
jgi:chromosome transmission fidelity protein 4